MDAPVEVLQEFEASLDTDIQNWTSSIEKHVTISKRDWPEWIGVDLDKTLAHSDSNHKKGEIGEPIPEMVVRIKALLGAGKTVKIFTARLADDPDGKEKAAITAWTKKVFGVALDATNEKDPGMVELYDDRAVQVTPNTGEIVT